MSYQSNLDKLMQMALLEQLNNIMSQIKNNSVPLSDNYEKEINCSVCKNYTCMFENILTKLDDHMNKFSSEIVRIENKLDELKIKNIITVSENRSDVIEKTDFSQQKLTSFCEENIVLKIEETEKIGETVCEYLKQEPHVEDDLEDEQHDIEDKKVVEEPTHEQEKDVIPDNQEEEEEDVEEEVVTDNPVDEDEDEEVGTDDQIEEEVGTDDQIEEEEVGTDDQMEEEEEEVKKDVEDVKEDGENTKGEEGEEGEEVFEIEIDEVTYFATDEENGILYEVDKDGEVGKKVGIIKDGEPIFS